MDVPDGKTRSRIQNMVFNITKPWVGQCTGASFMMRLSNINEENEDGVITLIVFVRPLSRRNWSVALEGLANDLVNQLGSDPFDF